MEIPVTLKSLNRLSFSDLHAMDRDLIHELASQHKMSRIACYRLSGSEGTLILDTGDNPKTPWPVKISSSEYYCTLKNKPHLTFGWQDTPASLINSSSTLKKTKSYLPPQEPWATKLLFIVNKTGRSPMELGGLDGFIEALARKFHFWLANDELRHFIDDSTLNEQLHTFGAVFSQVIGHEMRNPVTNLLSLAQSHAFLWKGAGAEVEQFAAEVENYSQRIWDVIQKLEILATNGSESFTPSETATDIDLRSLISEESTKWSRFHQNMSNQSTQQTSKILMSIGDGPFKISGVQSLVNLAFREVIQNAFIYAGGTPITISLYSSGNNIILDVSDEGMAIAPGQEELMFMRYFQGQKLNSQKSNFSRGLGLGLYLARFVCTFHNAQLLFVRGVQKKGVFRFIWPQNQPASKAS
jgi:K+-sensing histidine kinase KdpD